MDIEDKTNNKYIRRLALDEILSNLIVLSKNRKKFKETKKKKISYSIIH